MARTFVYPDPPVPGQPYLTAVVPSSNLCDELRAIAIVCIAAAWAAVHEMQNNNCDDIPNPCDEPGP